jgi:hypothetical protein
MSTNNKLPVKRFAKAKLLRTALIADGAPCIRLDSLMHGAVGADQDSARTISLSLSENAMRWDFLGFRWTP